MLFKRKRFKKSDYLMPSFEFLTNGDCYVAYDVDVLKKLMHKTERYSMPSNLLDDISVKNDEGFRVFVAGHSMFVLMYPVKNFGYLRLRSEICAKFIVDFLSARIDSDELDENEEELWRAAIASDIIYVLYKTGFRPDNGDFTCAMAVQMYKETIALGKDMAKD